MNLFVLSMCLFTIGGHICWHCTAVFLLAVGCGGCQMNTVLVGMIHWPLYYSGYDLVTSLCLTVLISIQLGADV